MAAMVGLGRERGEGSEWKGDERRAGHRGGPLDLQGGSGGTAGSGRRRHGASVDPGATVERSMPELQRPPGCFSPFPVSLKPVAL